MQRFLFLDRDGVINKDIGYLYKPEDIIYCDGIQDLVSAALKLEYKIAIITNQSGIGRQLFTEDQFHEIMKFILNSLVKNIENIKSGNLIYQFCPHLPNDNCNCRKPATGMFLNCQEEIIDEIDWEKSVMVGDKVSDMIAAYRMGIKNRYLLEHKENKFNDNSSFNFLNYTKINSLRCVDLTS